MNHIDKGTAACLLMRERQIFLRNIICSARTTHTVTLRSTSPSSSEVLQTISEKLLQYCLSYKAQ